MSRRRGARGGSLRFGLLPAVAMLAAVLLQRRYTLDATARAAS
ncbi:hypothetical protein [Micromonospora parastrephiae]|nr:hypothetical protein [Micromonospora parastrephiae]